MANDKALQLTKHDGWLVAHYSGPINLLVRDSLRQQIVSALDSSPGLDLVLDLSSVDMIDSAGLGTIFSLYKILVAQQRNLVLASPNRDVSNLLQVTHLDKVMQIKKNLAELLN